MIHNRVYGCTCWTWLPNKLMSHLTQPNRTLGLAQQLLSLVLWKIIGDLHRYLLYSATVNLEFMNVHCLNITALCWNLLHNRLFNRVMYSGFLLIVWVVLFVCIVGKIATVLGQLMKHSITVKELKSLIAALKGQEGKFWVSRLYGARLDTVTWANSTFVCAALTCSASDLSVAELTSTSSARCVLSLQWQRWSCKKSIVIL